MTRLFKNFELRNFPFARTLVLAGFLGMSCLVMAATHPAAAQVLSLNMGSEENTGTVTGRVVQMMALLTVLSLAPSILIMMTSFTRIIVVLSFLRSAIGLQQTPPNTVMVSLAIFLTFFIMTPTLQQSYEQGVKPLMNEEIDEVEAFKRGVLPFKTFMLKHVRESDLKLFLEVSKSKAEKAEDVELQVIIPAFMISELRRAFEIGFMLFLPFLVIDIVTSSILMSMGMMMLPPIVISLPFKIIFFVLVDGWHLVSASLIQSFDAGAQMGDAAGAASGVLLPSVPTAPVSGE
jgi:flagellar biosynthetic protein FliP